MPDVLIKPNTVTTAIDGVISRTEGPAVVIPLKARRITSRYVAPTFETTGDGDTTPVWENAELIYTQVTVFGFALAAAAAELHIALLDDQTWGTAPAGDGPAPTVTLVYGPNHQVILNVIIESIDIDYVKNAAAVSVIVRFRTTDWAPADITDPPA